MKSLYLILYFQIDLSQGYSSLKGTVSPLFNFPVLRCVNQTNIVLRSVQTLHVFDYKWKLHGSKTANTMQKQSDGT